MRINFINVLTLVFVVLKLCHQIGWSWWLVLWPLWVVLAWSLVYAIRLEVLKARR